MRILLLIFWLVGSVALAQTEYIYEVCVVGETNKMGPVTAIFTSGSIAASYTIKDGVFTDDVPENRVAVKVTQKQYKKDYRHKDDCPAGLKAKIEAAIGGWADERAEKAWKEDPKARLIAKAAGLTKAQWKKKYKDEMKSANP
jgi:hypothetical protein